MTTNGYLDTAVQKAFLPGTTGCLEQYEKLSAVIHEAHKRHWSLTVCWLDLANAYGNVHHQLIQFALKYYHAPQSFTAVVKGQWRAAASSHFPAVQKVEKLPGCPAAYFQRSSDSACHHDGDPEGTGRPKLQPMRLTHDLMVEDPGMSRRGLVARTKAKVTRDDANSRREHVESLPQQGQLMREMDEEAAEVWSAAVNSLPSEGLKFALNAASDTLLHNSNLSIRRRRKGLADGCKLCGRKQTLLHILNDCPVALELRQYNQHHDSVLNEIVGFIKPRLPPGANFIADLPGAMYQYPLQLAATDLRPDIVIWHENPKEATLIELTVCFETAFEAAIRRKTEKYQEQRVQSGDHDTEVGSQGVISVKGFKALLDVLTPVTKRDFRTFLITLSQTAILESQDMVYNWRDQQ